MSALLEVRDLVAGYGELAVLHGVSLSVAAGEVVAILGPNGAGKSTLLRAIGGHEATVRSGSIHFDGKAIAGSPPESLVRAGLVEVPEGRQLFTDMTVDDNLRLGGITLPKADVAAGLAGTYARFPALAARRGANAFSLSGGEQQMLAIARALMARPRLLMLDEPTSGLAPQVIERIFAIVDELRAAGVAVLLVEQNAYGALAHADRAFVLENGTIALDGTPAGLMRDERVQAVYLGGAAGESDQGRTRRAAAPDIARVRTMFAEYFEAIALPAALRDDQETITKFLEPPGGVWFAEIRGEVAGMVALRSVTSYGGTEFPGACEVKRLYVRPAYRRRGLALRLMEAVEGAAREAGFREIYLDTQGWMTEAATLYESLGYERCERYNDNPVAAIFMRKRL